MFELVGYVDVPNWKESSLTRAKEKAAEAISEHKIFLGGHAPEGSPSYCKLTHAVTYSAGPIQFCFRRACVLGT